MCENAPASQGSVRSFIGKEPLTTPALNTDASTQTAEGKDAIANDDGGHQSCFQDDTAAIGRVSTHVGERSVKEEVP